MSWWRASPAVLAAKNATQTLLGRIIVEYDGAIEHFAGDGLVVLFNAPMPVEDHELRAVQMTLGMREALSVLSAGWRKHGHQLGFGVGIAGGYATIGTIGFEQRLDYGAVGPATNLAARLCGEAKDKPILIAPRILAKVEEHVDVEALGEFTLKGFNRPVHALQCLELARGSFARNWDRERPMALRLSHRRQHRWHPGQTDRRFCARSCARPFIGSSRPTSPVSA